MRGRHFWGWLGGLFAVAWVCAMAPDGHADLSSGPVDVAAVTAQAEAGSADAQWKLGTLYWAGFGVIQNYLAARRWLQAAADRGHADAQCELGLLYQTRTYADTPPQDIPKALFWYEKAAEQGNGCGQFALAMLTESGQGTAQDAAKAVRLYAEAARHGYTLDRTSFPLQQLFAHFLTFARTLGALTE